MDEATLARFLAKVHVEPMTGCWLWVGMLSCQRKDRPMLNMRRGDRWIPEYAYRLAYEHFVGPIPDGLTIDHVRVRCAARPSCVNPDHLEPVTQAENVLRGDSFSAVNAKKTTCPRGHSFEADNLGITPNGRRFCRVCRRNRSNKRYQDPQYRERHKAAMRALYQSKKEKS